MVPERDQLSERLPSVLATIYLIFNEGYAASATDELIRHELCAEAIRLGRVLAEAMPDEREVKGLLGLMILHDAEKRGASGQRRAISSCSASRTARSGTATHR